MSETNTLLRPFADALARSPFHDQLLEAVDVLGGWVDEANNISDLIKEIAGVNPIEVVTKLIMSLLQSGSTDVVAAALKRIESKIDRLTDIQLQQLHRDRMERIADSYAVISVKLRDYVERYHEGLLDSSGFLIESWEDGVMAYGRLLATGVWTAPWDGRRLSRDLESRLVPPAIREQASCPVAHPWLRRPAGLNVDDQMAQWVTPPHTLRSTSTRLVWRFDPEPVAQALLGAGVTLIQAALTIRSMNVGSTDVSNVFATWIPDIERFAEGIAASVLECRGPERGDDRWAAHTHRVATRGPAGPTWDDVPAFPGRKPPNSVDGWPVGAYDTLSQRTLIVDGWKPAGGPALRRRPFDGRTMGEVWADDDYAAMQDACAPVAWYARSLLLERSGYFAIVRLVQAMRRVSGLPPWRPTGSPSCARPSARGVLGGRMHGSIRAHVQRAHPNYPGSREISLRWLATEGQPAASVV